MRRTLTIEYGDDVLLALGLSAGAIQRRGTVLVAVKLYELGRLSSGAAARLPIPKPLFPDQNWLTTSGHLPNDREELRTGLGQCPTSSVTLPLQYLYQADVLDLLPALFGQVCRPKRLWRNWRRTAAERVSAYPGRAVLASRWRTVRSGHCCPW